MHPKKICDTTSHQRPEARPSRRARTHLPMENGTSIAVAEDESLVAASDVRTDPDQWFDARSAIIVYRSATYTAKDLTTRR